MSSNSRGFELLLSLQNSISNFIYYQQITFLAFAADNAVLRRGDTLMIGKEAIKTSYGEIKAQDGSISLIWKG